MRLPKHYLKSGVYRFLEDVMAVNDWNGIMQKIADLDKYITDDLRALSDQTLQDIQKKMNDLQNDLGGLLDLTSEARDEAKVHILFYVLLRISDQRTKFQFSEGSKADRAVEQFVICAECSIQYL
ncbi:hypothetical protein N7488_012366 [Penicillium malachiteum]|nr:hypothetical protein N7488_012366 [Penicillium malachiteum]